MWLSVFFLSLVGPQPCLLVLLGYNGGSRKAVEGGNDYVKGSLDHSRCIKNVQ